MSNQPFLRTLEVLRQRLGELQECGRGDPPGGPGTLPEALGGLHATLEELRAGGEQLCRDNEELVAARRASQAEHQYRELFELAPDGHLVTDGEGSIREVNR